MPIDTRTNPRRMRLKDELLLAVLPTATVLITLALVESLGGREHLLCAALASSAFLVYLDPAHETNAVRALVLSQVMAAGTGWAVWFVLGPGYAAAGVAMSALILLMIILKVVHPPAVTTSLAFSLRPDSGGSLVLFAFAVGITAGLVLLQRISLWFISRRPRTGDLKDDHAGRSP